MFKKLIYGLVVGILCVMAFWIIYPPSTKAPKKSTELRLKNIEKAIRLLEKENHATIGEQLRYFTGGDTVQKKWELLLVDDAGRLEMSPRDIRNFLCRDAWGNSFNVELKSNLTNGVSFKMTGGSISDIVIWSSGPDGINQFGGGDDIITPTPINP
jgi:hypothetical protein